MEVAGFLFTCSTRMVPMIQNTHYISLERPFQWEFSAIEIVEIGSVFMEKTRNWFGSSSDKVISCFPNISPTALWISVKFDIYGKPLSRRIQRHRLRDMRTSFHWERRQLPERPPSDQVQDIAAFLIGSPFFWSLPLTRPTFSFDSTTIWTVWDMFLG